MHTLAVVLTTMAIEGALIIIILERYFVILLKKPAQKELLWRD